MPEVEQTKYRSRKAAPARPGSDLKASTPASVTLGSVTQSSKAAMRSDFVTAGKPPSATGLWGRSPQCGRSLYKRR
ncbi:hypothetical protein SCMU_17400 [Sinomonas cyclohexanicum]|uniref:Uncharacterized protein n=1 Tax=Sinomonas cyclohexanicum TaxID=322009 RepID=A0ABM7PUG6_SINCY|nr:hypothetical protein SCMU_17400 [Corynebacterium cyclohexanicum]